MDIFGRGLHCNTHVEFLFLAWRACVVSKLLGINVSFGLWVTRSRIMCEMDGDGHGIVQTRQTTLHQHTQRDIGHRLARPRRD